MRSQPIQYRITRIPAHLKNKQSYGISRTKALCNWHYRKPSGKYNINSDNELLKINTIKDEFKNLLKEIDEPNKNLMIEEMSNQDEVDVITINLKDENSIQNLAIKLINASLSEVEKKKKLIIFIG
ncbi:MAG: hypothetical protein MJ231_01640 [bacterium]|nr:hypothetical protein [bacterium]